MGLPNVKINLDNGQLGQLNQLAEGVAGLVCSGVAVSGKIQLADPRQIFSLQDAESIGLTEADNPAAYAQLRLFYAEAGARAELFVMLVPDTMTQTEMWDVTEANGMKKLVDYSQGRVRFAATHFAPAVSYTPTHTNEFDDDVFTAITKAQELCESYFDTHRPLRAIVEGRDFQGDAATAPDLTERTDNRVAVVAAGNTDDGVASVGLLIGRLAAVAVQRKPSRIRDGALAIDAAYVGNTAVEDFSGLTTLHDKGYIVLRTIVGRTGYFFSGDSTCAPASDDYNTLARGRVIDKAHMIAYDVYINYLDDEVIINTDGTLDNGQIKTMESQQNQAIALLMTAAGNISSGRTIIDPDQNVLATNKLEVGIRLIPVGYLTNIEVKLGFENPANL